MSRRASAIPVGAEIADRLAFAQISRIFPVSSIRRALERTDKCTIRQRELPNEFMAYFPMVLAIYRGRSQKEALRTLGDALRDFYGLSDIKVTGRSGISQARARVGFEPLKELLEECAIPLAKSGAEGCFYRDLRLVAIDGSSVDLEDNAENDEYFGGKGSAPLARLSGLVEVGTRAFFALAVGAWKHSSEISLAAEVIPKLQPGMLCLADRYYARFGVIRATIESGADLLFRRQENWKLEREEVLPDGSYISTVYDHKDAKRINGIKLRVLEFDGIVELQGKTTKTSYMLVTTLMDHRKYPFRELCELYRERWEFETVLDEMKTHLMAGQPLRSKTPELVIQEIYGMVLAHYVIRAVMYEAAASENLDPDRLSFQHSKNVLARYLPAVGSFPPSAIGRTHPRRDSIGAGLPL